MTTNSGDWHDRILSNRTIRDYLSNFDEKKWLKVVKYTLIAGIQDIQSAYKLSEVDEDALENHILARAATNNSSGTFQTEINAIRSELRRLSHELIEKRTQVAPETAATTVEVRDAVIKPTPVTVSVQTSSSKTTATTKAAHESVVRQMDRGRYHRQVYHHVVGKPSHAWRDGTHVPMKVLLSSPPQHDENTSTTSSSTNNQPPTSSTATLSRPQPRLAYTVVKRDDNNDTAGASSYIYNNDDALQPQQSKKQTTTKTKKKSKQHKQRKPHKSAYMLKRPPFCVSTAPLTTTEYKPLRQFRHVRSKVRSKVQADKQAYMKRVQRRKQSMRNMLSGDARVRGLSSSPKWEIYVPGQGKLAFGDSQAAVDTRVVTDRDPVVNISDSFLQNPLYTHFSERTQGVEVRQRQQQHQQQQQQQQEDERASLSLRQQTTQATSSPTHAELYDEADQSSRVIDDYFPSARTDDDDDDDDDDVAAKFATDIGDRNDMVVEDHGDNDNDDDDDDDSHTTVTIETASSSSSPAPDPPHAQSSFMHNMIAQQTTTTTTTTYNTTDTTTAAAAGGGAGDDDNESFWSDFQKRFPHLAQTASFARYRQVYHDDC